MVLQYSYGTALLEGDVTMIKITISDIAKEAGVSKSTVSRVLNGKPDVLPRTKERVLEVIEKYNFQPSALAVSMAQKKTNCIGLAIPHDIDYIFKNQYYSELHRTILKIAHKRKYLVLLLCCTDLQEASNAVRQKRLDGLIVISPVNSHLAAIQTFKDHEIPFVVIGSCPLDNSIYQIRINDYKGIVCAIEYLWELGHRDIAFINGPMYLPSSVERLKAYHDITFKYGLKKYDYEGRHSLESGYKFATIVLDEHPEVTAFCVSSDYMAIGVEKAVFARGLRVPEDISVIGFDNIPISEQVTPTLSTIDQFIEEKAIKSMNILLDIIEKKDIKYPYIINIEPKLCIRQSTAPKSS
ncbi:MAG: hypothetical protein BEN19_06240 [Epulopiscium sp. Nuni2H_MBin003]|nr:MAG: hypothetical protein BEN19_06240 [Epulopiscium sp. Nuni2H_MBin003]